MNKYLIISPIGDESLHPEWVREKTNFDLVLIYYGDNELVAESNIKYTPYVYAAKGEKYHLIKSFIESNIEFISNYTHIWIPDNDVLISTEDINRLFEMATQYQLSVCQPAMEGYVSHEITKPVPNSILRYTNFVEVLAPLFDLESLLKIYKTFDLNYSSWGYDYLWSPLLDYPKDKIAIIDDIIMTHTKPVGQSYSRFPVSPWEEMNGLLYSYNIKKEEINYSQIIKNEHIF
jgi:hypothetical protein